MGLVPSVRVLHPSPATCLAVGRAGDPGLKIALAGCRRVRTACTFKLHTVTCIAYHIHKFTRLQQQHKRALCVPVYPIGSLTFYCDQLAPCGHAIFCDQTHRLRILLRMATTGTTAASSGRAASIRSVESFACIRAWALHLWSLQSAATTQHTT